jgi:hypothetical protein
VADAPLCSALSCHYGEQLHGTASRVRNWLLIEQGGPWGRDALTESGLDLGLGSRLKRAAQDHGVRVLLIRRPGAQEQSGCQCFVAHTGIEHHWIQHCPVEDPSEILEVDLSCLREGERPALGTSWEGPLYLVCANEEHDRCCGIHGRPVAHALAQSRGARTWESSHLGGDRFAANLVCLPHGLYFGRLRPGNVTHVASSYERGVIDLAHYRGRSHDDPITQAAEVLVRTRRGFDGLEDLVLEARTNHGRGESTLEFRDRSGRIHVIRLAAVRGERRRLTCEATYPGAPREFRVTPLDPVP